MDSCKIESLRPGIYLLCKGHHHLFMFRIVLASIFAAAAFVFFRRRRRRRHGLDQKSLGVLIFGGTSGIGKAMCDEFLAHGDRVVVASRRTGCNVTDEKSVEDCILNAKNELGRIDLVINMAAMGQRQHVLVKDSSVTELESVVKTNVLGTLIVSKISARLLEPGSRIVLVGGAGTSSKRPTIGHATYAFSKAGLSQFVASLAAENPSLGVHLLVPGIAITPLLAVKERSELSRWYFNVLGEMPETMAKLRHYGYICFLFKEKFFSSKDILFRVFVDLSSSRPQFLT